MVSRSHGSSATAMARPGRSGNETRASTELSRSGAPAAPVNHVTPAVAGRRRPPRWNTVATHKDSPELRVGRDRRASARASSDLQGARIDATGSASDLPSRAEANVSCIGRLCQRPCKTHVKMGITPQIRNIHPDYLRALRRFEVGSQASSQK